MTDSYPSNRVCVMGGCGEPAIIEAMGESGHSWRRAWGCPEHAQRVVDYCSKPADRWREDYQLVAKFDHATREWVPVPEEQR